jgi:hypothetical protein
MGLTADQKSFLREYSTTIAGYIAPAEIQAGITPDGKISWGEYQNTIIVI